MTEKAETRLRLNLTYVLASLLAVSAALTGLVAILYLESSARYDALISRFDSLEDRNRALESQLDDMRQLITPSNVSSGLTAVQVFKLVERSVVLVRTKVQTTEGLVAAAQGSGFVYDLDGHIITNNHVVEGADEVEITFVDGSVRGADLVGTDPYSDLAVLVVEAPLKLLHPVTLGNSSEILVGQPVFALGNPFGLSDSMTSGIVSQVDRELGVAGGYLIIGVIQVDAAVNPGNSGGPLLDSRGMVIGVNTAIETTTGVFAGVGFAIPSNTVRRVAYSLITAGKYEHPWVGIRTLDVTSGIAEAMALEEPKGFLIIDVVDASPAAEAGLRGGTTSAIIEGQSVVIGGDVVIGVDGREVRVLYDALTYLERRKAPGDTVTFTVIRNGQVLMVDLTLGVRPPP